jgi:hypothetical protein
MPSDQPDKSLDVFGTKPLAAAVEKLATSAADGASSFLARICLPAAEEFGLLLQDKVRGWRASNAATIAKKAEEIHKATNVPPGYHGHPRLIGAIVEHGSWIQDDQVQGLWAGLLSSSCSNDGEDDSNLMFVDLLSRLAVSQVRLLDHACRSAPKHVTQDGWLVAAPFQMTLEQLVAVTGIADSHRIDRELDHLRSLGLLELLSGGFTPGQSEAGVTPTSLALHFYARAHGCAGDPLEYFRAQGPVVDVPAA